MDNSATGNDIQKQLSVLQKDVSELTRIMGEYGRAQGESLKESASRKAHELRDEADARFRRGEAQARDAYMQAETAVRDNPAAAMGIAAGLGFLVGLITARR